MPRRILLVEDEAPARDALRRLLAQAGHEVVAVSGVPEAKALLADDPPALLITDVRLDRYNGLHLIATAAAYCPAIVITGYIDAAIEADARRLGAEYLSKPVSGATLCATVDRLLAKRTERPAPSERIEVRTWLSRAMHISGAGTTGRLLGVSERGALLELGVGADVTPTDTLTFDIDPGGASIEATVVWKRYQAGAVRCGVAVTSASMPAWRAFLTSALPQPTLASRVQP